MTNMFTGMRVASSLEVAQAARSPPPEPEPVLGLKSMVPAEPPAPVAPPPAPPPGTAGSSPSRSLGPWVPQAARVATRVAAATERASLIMVAGSQHFPNQG